MKLTFNAKSFYIIEANCKHSNSSERCRFTMEISWTNLVFLSGFNFIVSLNS